MTPHFWIRLLFVTAAFSIASVSFAVKPSPTPTPKPTATPTPAPTPTPTPKPTATPTPTPKPSATPTPSPTATPIPTAYCPLPADYGLTSSSANSPEKGPGPLKAVCHKGAGVPKIILCLPPNAYNAHIQHGDTPVAYNCTKEGNQGPCP